MSYLAHVASGTLPLATGTGTGTTSCAPNYPTGLLEGDLLLMPVMIKPDTATAPTITDWTKVPNGEAAGGGGSTGLDTGPTRLCWYYRVVGSTAPSGTLTVTPGSSPSCCMAQMYVIASAARAGLLTPSWSVEGANGIDTTTGTPFTAVMGSDPGITVGDLVFVAGSIPTDVTVPAQFSAETLTASGLTSGSLVSEVEFDSSQGNDQGGVVCLWRPTAGPSSGVATFSATAGGTTTNVRGPICLVRVRETTSDPSPLTSVLDDFDRADGAVGANWGNDVPNFAATQLEIASNQAKTTGYSDSYWAASTFAYPAEAGCTIATEPTGDVWLWLGVIGPDAAGADGYQFVWEADNGFRIDKMVNNGFTTQLSTTGISRDAGDGLRAAALVNAATTSVTLYAFFKHGAAAWACSMIVRDASTPLTATGYIGLGLDDADPDVGRIDDFFGGTMILDTGRPKQRRRVVSPQHPPITPAYR